MPNRVPEVLGVEPSKVQALAALAMMRQTLTEVRDRVALALESRKRVACLEGTPFVVMREGEPSLALGETDDGRSWCFVVTGWGVSGLLDTISWTRERAEEVARLWNAEVADQPVVVVGKRQLLELRLAELESMLVLLDERELELERVD
jgi:hypothetical protein